MAKKIFCFALQNGSEPGAQEVLGFDTGLDAQAFAQAKMAQFITQSGCLVYPDGKTEPWKAVGVCERGTMVVWGPSFPGESLDQVLTDSSGAGDPAGSPGNKDEAMAAVRSWLKARIL